MKRTSRSVHRSADFNHFTGVEVQTGARSIMGDATQDVLHRQLRAGAPLLLMWRSASTSTSRTV
jgi:hypothetical protein